MTENEAIREVRFNMSTIGLSDKAAKRVVEARNMAIKALETIKKLSDRKMTVEVLENYMQFEDEYVKKGFTFKSAIEAREKQIARKPDFTEDKEFALCPCCNGKGLFDKQKYCDNCGQKLDWSEESEE